MKGDVFVRRRMANVFAITYPITQRDVYDPIVERMENTFKPGRRRQA